MLSKKTPEQEKIERGRERLQSFAPQRDEAWEFFRGNHFAYVDEKGVLQHLSTVTTVRGTGKPRYRARQKRNLVFDVVLRKASVAAQRIPNYSILPSTNDPEDLGAARLSQKVAEYGYHQWNIRRITREAVMHAIVAGEAFAWVYFDNTIGPFIGDQKGNVGLGDVRVRIYGANQCYWEPGLRFEESPWHALDLARTIEEVEQMEGFKLKPGKLTPDANSKSLSDRGRGKSDKPKLVLVTDYLELPCPKYPQGRWCTYANGQEILEERPYPGEGDQPCLRKLSYAPDPDSDRDLGLVPQIIDAMRTKNDAINKQVEWKNLCLHPRIAVSPGLMKKQRWTAEPGKVYEIPQPEQNLKVIETPPVPRELFEMDDRAGRDIDRIAATGPMDASQIESGKEAQALGAAAEGREQQFIADLADWHGKIMHDCLVQVQHHYTEPRLLQIRGRFGPEPIEDFKGAQLRSQVDVRVTPDSIEPRSRQQVEQKISNIAAMFPGAFPPEEVVSAINRGTAESLLDSFELAKSRVHTIIQKIRNNSFLDAPMRPVLPGEDAGPEIDPETGQPIVIGLQPGAPDPLTGEPGPPQPQYQMASEVPEWMPRPFDNIRIFKKEMEDWMQTQDWDTLPPEGKEGANLYYQALLDLEAKQAEREALMQQQQAEALGMANAGKPQGPSPLPSQPAINGERPPKT